MRIENVNKVIISTHHTVMIRNPHVKTPKFNMKFTLISPQIFSFLTAI